MSLSPSPKMILACPPNPIFMLMTLICFLNHNKFSYNPVFIALFPTPSIEYTPTSNSIALVIYFQSCISDVLSSPVLH